MFNFGSFSEVVAIFLTSYIQMSGNPNETASDLGNLVF